MFNAYNLEDFENAKKIHNEVYLRDAENYVISKFQRTENTWHYALIKGYRVVYMDNCIIDLQMDVGKNCLYINSNTIISTKLDGKYLYIHIENEKVYFNSSMNTKNMTSIDKLHYCDKEKILKLIEKIIKEIKTTETEEKLKEMILNKYLKLDY